MLYLFFDGKNVFTSFVDEEKRNVMEFQGLLTKKGFENQMEVIKFLENAIINFKNDLPNYLIDDINIYLQSSSVKQQKCEFIFDHLEDYKIKINQIPQTQMGEFLSNIAEQKELEDEIDYVCELVHAINIATNWLEKSELHDFQFSVFVNEIEFVLAKKCDMDMFGLYEIGSERNILTKEVEDIRKFLTERFS